ncbi:MAG TPA: hypothetical protein VMT34_05685, partial [Aggregatilineales bacterium]|nr:hypothetical protein [Aggregatilineales bacterium]
MATGRTLFLWAIGGFAGAFFIPFILGPNQALWQDKVPPGLQGRVFAIRGMLTLIANPVGMLLGGLLADHVFEPALLPGGALSGVFGGLVGTGPGSGMALMFVMTSTIGMLLAVGSYTLPMVRRIEEDTTEDRAADEVPDALHAG